MTEVSLEETRGANPPLERGGALDALRFLAAFWMVLYHYADQGPVSLFTLHPAFERGYLATNFFLMLSGYVLGRTYGPRFDAGRISPGSFLIRRIARIWPAHLVMVAAFVALFLGTAAIGVEPANPQWFDWGQLPAQVFLIQAWGLPGRSGWNIVTWSLSALVVCYALFPLLWDTVRRLRSPWVLLGAVLLLFAAADLSARLLFEEAVFRLPLRWGVFRALPLFFVGVALARLTALVAVPRGWALPAAAGALVLMLGLQLAGRYDHLSLALLAGVIFAAGASRSGGSRLVTAGAALAFALFLTNYFVGVAWFGALAALASRLSLGDGFLWAGWAVAPAIAVAFAWAFRKAVDDPLQAWIKPRLRPGRANPGAAALTPA